jgi:hypothetical protein
MLRNGMKQKKARKQETNPSLMLVIGIIPLKIVLWVNSIYPVATKMVKRIIL